MKTADILLPVQCASHVINEGITKFAQHKDADQLTEAAVEWGKIVQAAWAIIELEHPMRTLLWAAAREAAKQKGGE